VLAVVTAGDEVAPAASIDPFIAAVAASDLCRIDYAGETGVGLLHLGALIGRDAHARVWPQIVQWLQAHGSAPPAGRSESRPPDAAFGPTP
jgi:polyhydroxyalkanoate synthase